MNTKEENKIDFRHRQFEDVDTETTRNSIRIEDRAIDKDKAKFPYCLVWTSIPGLTTLLPFIGHIGICTKDGTIHDFAGPYTVSIDDFSFGKPQKYIALEPDEYSIELWDQAIEKADNKFRNEMVI